MQDLKNKYGCKALVTGGSSGMGRAFAFELAKQGIEPILIARSKDKLDETANEIFEKHNVKAQVYSVDLSDENAITTFLSQIENEKIGLLIHAAGMENNGGFTKVNPQKELMLIKLNVTATYLLTNHFAKKMTQNKKGGILLISSMAGLMPTPYFSNYAASKAYVHNLGLSLYPELKDKGVDISVLAPGLTETNMVADNGIDWSKLPMSSMKPEKVAKITLSNLGNKATIIPGFMNKMMVAMSKRVFSMKSFSSLQGSLIKKAISDDKL